MESVNLTRIPLQVSRNCVVASIQVDFSEGVLTQFRRDLLELLQSSGAEGVILDVSGVPVMDLEDFDDLRKILKMADLMGVDSVIAGLRPGVVASLVELQADVLDVTAVRNLDEGFLRIEALHGSKAESSGGDVADEVGEPDG